jgi:hypothetical protein
MKNRIYTLLVGIGLLSGTAYGQPPRIVVQGAGAPQVFASINAAISAAQPNDKLYLSGGTISSLTELVIDKPLHFIGAGINPDSTAVTGVTTLTTAAGDIVITTPATGSTFTGLVLSAAGGQIYFGLTIADDDPTGIVFERCRFLSQPILGRSSSGVSNTTFEECIFNIHINGANTGGTFNRCIFDYQTGTSSAINSFYPLEISHCVFLYVQAFRNSDAAYMENSISVYGAAAVYQSNASTVTNCLFTHTALVSNSSGVISTNNQFGVAAASIFVDQLDLDYQFSDDLHMAIGSPGIAWANDGTDVGIYGSGTPYKPGNVPYNPHQSAAVIANSTNGNSELPVNITVIAQPN